MPQTSSPDIVIVGAGFAGVATAFHLARRAPDRKVLLLEREDIAGMHSSGRNAGMIRQVTSEETVSRLARRGASFIQGLAPGSGILRATGSVLIAGRDKAAQLRADMAKAREGGLEVLELEPAEARRRFPALERADFDVACHSPGDGVVDLVGLVRWYLDAARSLGVEVRLGENVEAVLTRDGRVLGVRSGAREIEASVVVNAAGPWAGDVGAMAGAAPMPLRPRRRHVFVTEPAAWVDPGWPFLWDVSTEVYFRPEEGGLLLSPCDESDPGDKGSDAGRSGRPRDPPVEARAAVPAPPRPPRRPSLVRRAHPDPRSGRFVVGPDPTVRGFFWVAGLGGHGVTTSHAVGRARGGPRARAGARRGESAQPGAVGLTGRRPGAWRLSAPERRLRRLSTIAGRDADAIRPVDCRL